MDERHLLPPPEILQSKSQVEIKSSTCEVCKMQFRNKFLLDFHIRSNHVTESFICPVIGCEYKNNVKKNFKKHFILIHSDEGRNCIERYLRDVKVDTQHKRLQFELKTYRRAFEETKCNKKCVETLEEKCRPIYKCKKSTSGDPRKISEDMQLNSRNLETEKLKLSCESEEKNYAEIKSKNSSSRLMDYQRNKINTHKFDEKFTKVSVESQTSKKQYDFFCKICNKKFESRRKFTKHNYRLHRNVEYGCLVEGCDFTKPNKDSFKKHLESHRHLQKHERAQMLRDIKPIFIHI